MTGILIAMVSVLTSSLQQTSVRKMQSVRKKEALDLIASVGPGSGVILVILSPVMDYRVAKQWITEYYWNTVVIWGILLSTSLAILVNLSQFLCLGKFSAVQFQVRRMNQVKRHLNAML
jgi:solute carrier family 35 protein E3